MKRIEFPELTDEQGVDFVLASLSPVSRAVFDKDESALKSLKEMVQTYTGGRMTLLSILIERFNQEPTRIHQVMESK